MKVIILHGSNEKDRENMVKYNLPPQNERDWIGWIKERLEVKGIECVAPLMPENWAPVYEKWKEEFEKILIDEDDILIGWSSGGAFLTRWLGENDVKVGKLILLAPYIVDDNFEDGLVKDFHNFKIRGEISNRVDEIILIESDNDGEELLKCGEVFSRRLGIEPIVLHAKGHFTGHRMGREFPELLEEILND